MPAAGAWTRARHRNSGNGQTGRRSRRCGKTCIRTNRSPPRSSRAEGRGHNIRNWVEAATSLLPSRGWPWSLPWRQAHVFEYQQDIQSARLLHLAPMTTLLGGNDAVQEVQVDAGIATLEFSVQLIWIAGAQGRMRLDPDAGQGAAGLRAKPWQYGVTASFGLSPSHLRPGSCSRQAYATVGIPDLGLPRTVICTHQALPTTRSTRPWGRESPAQGLSQPQRLRERQATRTALVQSCAVPRESLTSKMSRRASARTADRAARTRS